MNREYQFPPSSPLVSGNGAYDEGEHDPFGVKGKGAPLGPRGRADYPTPNPSSSLGRSSSPAREQVDLGVKPKKSVKFDLEAPAARDSGHRQVSVNRDFNILDPDANVLRVPFVEGKSSLLIGRSSKACDFYLNAKDKTISRTHIAVSHAAGNQMTLRCLGYNGFAMRIPKPCVVYGTSKQNDYMLLENKSRPLSVEHLGDLGLTVSPRTIKLDSNHTEFVVNRNESVTVPKLNNILIEIRNNLILLNPVEDEADVTDDEMPVLIESHRPKKPLVEAVTKPVFQTPDQHVLFSMPSTPSKHEFKVTSEEPTPIKPHHKHNFSDSSIKKTLGYKPFEIYEDFNSASEPFNDESTSPVAISLPRQTTPLGDKLNTFSSTEPPKRAQSEEPQKPSKRKKKSQLPPQKVDIDQSCVENVSNIPEINNILVNHLAFSRLSSTPASFLNTISAITSELSLKQIRVILHNIKAIGVIYREGKDAAGKPLEEEYYYMPENDDDSERPNLVSSIKGHGGLRSCRRTHKQYYWKKPAPIKK